MERRQVDRQSFETAVELRGAVSRATRSLNALAEGWKHSTDRHGQKCRPHMLLQQDTVNEFGSVVEEEVGGYEKNIERCLDLLERLEKAEVLAKKIKSLRGTVDRISDHLDKQIQLRS